MKSLSITRYFGSIGLFLVFLCLASGAIAQTRKPAQAAQVKKITIISEPKAIVWIDGVRYGTTDENGDLKISTVLAGKHTIRVRAEGFKEVSQPLLANPKGEVKIVLVETTDEAELAYQQGEVLALSNRQKAVEAYEKAIKLRPKYPEVWLALARIYSDMGDYDNAEKAIREARRLRPGYAEASAIEGRVFHSLDDDVKAIASYKRAITEGKGFQPEAYTGLGLHYKEKAESFGGNADYAQEAANYTEAAKNLAVAVKQLSGAPDAPVIYQLLGLVYEQQKKYKEAIALYEEFLRLFPDSSEATAIRSFIVQLNKQLGETK